MELCRMQAKYMLNCINIVYSFNPIMIAQEQKNLGIPFGNLQVIFKANTYIVYPFKESL